MPTELVNTMYETSSHHPVNELPALPEPTEDDGLRGAKFSGPAEVDGDQGCSRGGSRAPRRHGGPRRDGKSLRPEALHVPQVRRSRSIRGHERSPPCGSGRVPRTATAGNRRWTPPRQAPEALARRLDEVESYLHIDERRRVGRSWRRGAHASDFGTTHAASRSMHRAYARQGEDVQGIEDARTRLGDASATPSLAWRRATATFSTRRPASGSPRDEAGRARALSWFADDLDHGDATITVTPGQEGSEAQDWCDMLFNTCAYCDCRG